MTKSSIEQCAQMFPSNPMLMTAALVPAAQLHVLRRIGGDGRITLQGDTNLESTECIGFLDLWRQPNEMSLTRAQCAERGVPISLYRRACMLGLAGPLVRLGQAGVSISSEAAAGYYIQIAKNRGYMCDFDKDLINETLTPTLAYRTWRMIGAAWPTVCALAYEACRQHERARDTHPDMRRCTALPVGSLSAQTYAPTKNFDPRSELIAAYELARDNVVVSMMMTLRKIEGHATHG